MTQEDVQQVLRQSLHELFQRDAHILDVQANERSITHRLAIYLENALKKAGELNDYSVDCEYNRDGHEPKSLSLGKERSVRDDDTEAVTVFPDIVVHRRGSNDDNFLVVELKKSTSQGREYDRQKLKSYKNDLGYRYAIFVCLEVRGAPDFKLEFF